MSNVLVLLMLVLLNFILGLVKVVVGIFCMSQSLVVDGLDSFMDSINAFIGIFATKHSEKAADEGHPYGHGNSEYIATLILSMVVIVAALTLIKSIFDGSFVIESAPTILALITIIATTVIKVFMSFVLITTGKKRNNKILSALGVENLSDLPKSGIAIVGTILAVIGVEFAADKIAGIIIAALFLLSGIKLAVDAINCLNGKSAPKELVNKIKTAASRVGGVISIGRFNIVERGPYYTATIDITVDGNISVREGHDIAEEVRAAVAIHGKFGFIVVHVDPSK